MTRRQQSEKLPYLTIRNHVTLLPREGYDCRRPVLLIVAAESPFPLTPRFTTVISIVAEEPNACRYTNYQRLPDSDLLERFIEGRDELAFGELVSRHGGVVMSACRRRLSNEQDCQDAFQATFLTLVTKGKWIRQKSSVGGWLQRVAVRVAIDVQRANARRNTVSEQMDISDAKVDNETPLMIEEELARLPANYRNAIVLCHLEGHTSNEAAEILDVPRNTLNSWLVRGRNLLRKRLVKQGVVLSITGLISGVTGLGGTSNVQAELIQETSRAASLYAAGYPAASTTATALAKATISKMVATTLTKAVILTATIAALLVTVAPTFTGLVSSAYANEFEDDELKKLTNEVVDLVSPAIVRFSYRKDSPYHFGCGVIVSPEGHIAVSGPVQAVIDNEQLQLRLSDGRIVKGEALGWSGEFGFGMLKIAEDGPWPHVEVNHRPKVGEVSVALGYGRDSDVATATNPDVKLGLVTKSSRGRWLATSHLSQFSSHPVFDLRGKLLGLNCKSPASGDPIHASATLITKHWDDFVAGKNLDRTRLFTDKEATKRGELSKSGLSKAIAASVRISNLPGDATKTSCSGTIVSANGYVITCGHHHRLPGENLRVTLKDGRSATATVLGTNFVCDVGVLRISKPGPWPYVEMGHSAECNIGTPCVLLGYPNLQRDQDTWTFRTEVIKPTQTLTRRDDWYDEFWTAKFPDSIHGVSGGGVFGPDGRVIGVLLGGVDEEMQHARIELFQKKLEDPHCKPISPSC